jgi:hypothetical protein
VEDVHNKLHLQNCLEVNNRDHPSRLESKVLLALRLRGLRKTAQVQKIGMNTRIPQRKHTVASFAINLIKRVCVCVWGGGSWVHILLCYRMTAWRCTI